MAWGLAARMPDVRMAMHARRHVTASGFGQQRMHEILMARNAGALRDAAISGFDLDRIFESAGRERQRVEKAVVRLGHPLADEVMGKVAVIANRHMVMTALLPRIHVILHHVTIHARVGVVAQVTGATSIPKRERAQPRKQPQSNRE